MDNRNFDFRLKVVQYYLNHKTSLRKAAMHFNVNYRSVFKWVKQYRTKGEIGLINNYHRAWNRKDEEIEKKIALLKEREPKLTVRMARSLLEKEGIKISLKGIWAIWRRYGYAGFKKGNITNNFTTYISWTEEAKAKFETAKRLFTQGKKSEAAQILNSIPALPSNELVIKIPDDLLNLTRRIEKAGILFKEIPLAEYLNWVKELYRECKKQGRNYSALRTGIMETIALSWLPSPEEQLKKLEIIENLINKEHSVNYWSYLLFESYFTINICKGITYSYLLKIKDAYRCASICKRLLKNRKHRSAYLSSHLGYLYSNLQDYTEAEHWFLESLGGVEEATKKRLLGTLAHIYLYKGEYNKAIKLSKYVNYTNWGAARWDVLFYASLSLVKGMPNEAISQVESAISLFERDNIVNNLFKGYFVIASASVGLGKKKEAVRMIKNLIPILKKNKMEAELAIAKNLITSNDNSNSAISVNLLPSVKLLLLLKNGEYYNALNFARRKGITDYFYKYCIWFNDKINLLIKKNKPTELPRTLLELPVFKKETPVYHIKFLGNLIVFKNQEYLKMSIKPKDFAFLIYLSQKAMEPKRAVNLDEVYSNFWPKSEKASRNFSHLLMRVKKAIKIPSHLLAISRSYGEASLINEGIYFTTDYQEFKQTLARAKALQRAGEWEFAKKEFLQAFKLFRGEPLKRNFDNWSVDMRFKILSELETEAIEFAKACLEHNDKHIAKKVLEKVLKIIPDSEEIKNLLDSPKV